MHRHDGLLIEQAQAKKPKKPGRQPLPPGHARATNLTLRASKVEIRRLTKEAAAAGLTVTGLIRRRVFGDHL